MFALYYSKFYFTGQYTGGYQMNISYLLPIFLFALVSGANAQSGFATDKFATSKGELGITFIGHGTLMMTYRGKVIHIDPWGGVADYSLLPKADLILLTHEHIDHLDPKALELIKKPGTVLIYTEACSGLYDGGIIMHNHDKKTVMGIRIEAVPAYNIVQKRSDGALFHPKGCENGYILTFGDLRVYIGAETEVIKEMREMKEFRNIDVAFLSMSLPYNMTPETLAEAARIIRPKILYPYHFRGSDTEKLKELLKDEIDIEIRIRNLE